MSLLFSLLPLLLFCLFVCVCVVSIDFFFSRATHPLLFEYNSTTVLKLIFYFNTVTVANDFIIVTHYMRGCICSLHYCVFQKRRSSSDTTPQKKKERKKMKMKEKKKQTNKTKVGKNSLCPLLCCIITSLSYNAVCFVLLGNVYLLLCNCAIS